MAGDAVLAEMPPSPILGAMELEFVKWLRGRLPPHRNLALPAGDDAAVIRLAGRDCVLTVDMLTEGVDFQLDRATPRQVGRKALAVNLSDIAAMAAQPVAALVALALPRHGALELAREFYEGLMPLAERYDVAIAGGDTNSWDGPLVVSITLVGRPTAQGAARRGARARRRDRRQRLFGGSILGAHFDFEPRVEEALLLAGRYELHAGIDCSDGLSLDLWRLTEESGCGAVVELAAFRWPKRPASWRALADGSRPLDHALGDGEDFELILAVPTGRRRADAGRAAPGVRTDGRSAISCPSRACGSATPPGGGRSCRADANIEVWAMAQGTLTWQAADEGDTERLGRALAAVLAEGGVVGLIGPLGAGKTRLVQGIAAALGVDRRDVVSPTFVLVHEYRGGRPIYHLDTYRLRDSDEFLQLGVEEYFAPPNVVFVEWADRFPECLPRSASTSRSRRAPATRAVSNSWAAGSATNRWLTNWPAGWQRREPGEGRSPGGRVTSWPGGHRVAASEDELAQILVLRQLLQPLVHVGGVDVHPAHVHVRRLEAELFQQSFHDGVQSPGADVLARLVDLKSVFGQRLDGLGLEHQLDPLGAQQGTVLLGQGAVGLGQDAHEIVAGQRLQLDANRKAALQLGHQFARLVAVERAGGDEQHVIGRT